MDESLCLRVRGDDGEFIVVVVVVVVVVAPLLMRQRVIGEMCVNVNNKMPSQSF
jgi:hypothetical protein